jgi:hypothetical protein
VTQHVGLWGRLPTCGGLVTRLPTLAKRAIQRAAFHPAPQLLPGVMRRTP